MFYVLILMAFARIEDFPLVHSERGTLHTIISTENRMLESVLKSAVIGEYSIHNIVQIDPQSLDDNDNINWMWILISSPQSGLSDGNCALFQRFSCSNPSCSEDDSAPQS